MTTTTTRRKVFTTAWQICKSEGLCISCALRRAWKQIKFNTIMYLLRRGTVAVTFRKTDGSITTRLATRSFDLLPAQAHPKGSARWEQTWDVVPFYSIGDEGWRSFRLDSLIKFQPVAA